MHQILGIRTYVDKNGKEQKTDKFFDKTWRVSDLNTLLQHPKDYLDLIPEDERYNIFVTFASCLEEKGRKLKEQWVIPFDIDDIDYNRIPEYTSLICRVLGLNYNETGFIATGNGLHVLVGITLPILDKEFFENNKLYYKTICSQLEFALREAELPFKEVDPMVFAQAFMTRLPGTENRKKDKQTKVVRCLNSVIVKIDFDLKERSGLADLPEGEALTKPLMKEKLNRLPADSNTVLSQCPFMVYASTSIGISERQWYNALNIASHLPDGLTKCHEISRHDPRYSHHETSTKATQAYEKSGPMKCSTIANTWDGCKTCPHYGVVVSPILLKGNDFIATEDNGFRTKTKEGGPGKVVTHDVVKYFMKKFKHISLGSSSIVYYWNQTQWEAYPDNKILKWCMDTIKPSPEYSECEKIFKMITLENIVEDNFFVEATNGYMNFKNGVFDLKSLELKPHDACFGFTNTIPFEYNLGAKCPKFLNMISKITLGKKELELVIQEYAGYILSGSEYRFHKILVLDGEGENGKSTLIDILRYCLGSGNYSSLPFKSIVDKKDNHEMMFKLANFSEEVGHREFINASAEMKNLSSGGEYQVRKLYKDSVTIRNRTKIVLACNDLPSTDDCSNGFKRRLLIVPFKAVINKQDPDFDTNILEKLKLEASGIINWMVDGFRRLIANDGFSSGEIIAETVGKYISDNNTIDDFMVNELTISDNLIEHKQELYEQYASYTRLTGAYPLKKTRFFKQFEILLRGQRSLTDLSYRYKIYGSANPVYCIKGLCLNKNLDRQSNHF